MGYLSQKPECFGSEFEDDDDTCLMCAHTDACQRKMIMESSRYNRNTALVRRKSIPTKSTRIMSRSSNSSSGSGNVAMNKTVARPLVRLDDQIRAPESGEFFGELMSSMVSTVGYSLGDYFFFRRFRFNRKSEPVAEPVVDNLLKKPQSIESSPCPSCGASVNSKYMFCPKCGEELYEED